MLHNPRFSALFKMYRLPSIETYFFTNMRMCCVVIVIFNPATLIIQFNQSHISSNKLIRKKSPGIQCGKQGVDETAAILKIYSKCLF